VPQTHPFIAQWYRHCPHCTAELKQELRSAACEKCGYAFYLNPAPCVTVVIEHEDKILLGKRAVEPKAGLWNFIGGFVDIDETAEQAVHREVREETGIAVEIVAQLGETMPDTYDDFSFPTLTFIYLVKPLELSVKPHDDVAELVWAKPTDIDLTTVAFDNDKAALQRYQTYKKEHHD
jgi:NAD+ diphosphatase